MPKAEQNLIAPGMSSGYLSDDRGDAVRIRTCLPPSSGVGRFIGAVGAPSRAPPTPSEGPADAAPSSASTTSSIKAMTHVDDDDDDDDDDAVGDVVLSKSPSRSSPHSTPSPSYDALSLRGVVLEITVDVHDIRV